MSALTRRRLAGASALLLLSSLVPLLALPALGSTEQCPDAVDATWTKVDQASGSELTAEGVQLEWAGISLSYDVPAGYALDVCLKFSTNTNTQLGLTGAGTVQTDGQHEISHIAYRVNELSPTTGSITIVKDAVPGSPQTFDFTSTLGDFTLDDNADATYFNNKTFSDLTAGTYDFAEVLPLSPGWALTSLTCDTGTGESTATVDLGAGSVSIELASGEHVTCTFVNTLTPSIKIVKDAVPGSPQTFDFTGDLGTFTLDDNADATYFASKSFFGLPAGTYDFAEVLPLPSGWALTSLTCTNGEGGSTWEIDLATASVSIDLVVGELVVCTFVNTYTPPQPDPAIDIEKATNGQDADTPTGPSIPVGTAVSWTYVVTNTGNVTLFDVAVSDDKEVSVSCPKTILEPGEEMTCNASGTAVLGQYANVGFVEGWPEGDEVPVTDSDPSHYVGFVPPVSNSVPGVDIEKATNGQDADTPTGPVLEVGDAVTWTYLVRNTGDVALSGITVTDSDPAVTVTCPKTTLAVGESMTCSASGLAVAGQYSNIGSVATAQGVSDTDPSHYSASLVFGTTIVAPTTTAALVSPATLPFTGSETGSTLALGMALAGLGGLVLAAVKREEEEEARARL